MKTEANSVGREVGVRGKGHDGSASCPDRLRPHCLRLSNMKRTQRWFIQDSVVIRAKIKTAHTQKKNPRCTLLHVITHIHTLCILVWTGCHRRSIFTSVFIPKESKMSSDVLWFKWNEKKVLIAELFTVGPTVEARSKNGVKYQNRFFTYKGFRFRPQQ